MNQYYNLHGVYRQKIFVRNSNIKSKFGKEGLKVIGHVVTQNKKIDSLIFEFLPGIDVKLNTIRVSLKEESSINLSGTMLETSKLTENVELLAFSAQSRGTNGHINRKRPSKEDNINEHCSGICSSNENEPRGSRQITFDGDSGVIGINSDRIPVAIHHGASCTSNDTHLSWVIPLALIIQKHSKYFGVESPPSHTSTISEGRSL